MGFFSKLLGKGKAGTPSLLVHEAFDGLIRVYGVPEAPAGSAMEDVREGDGFLVHVLKYVLYAEPFPLTLSAKVYTLHEDLGAPEDPALTDWVSAFELLFATAPEVHTSSTEQTTMTHKVPAAEAVVTGPERESGVALSIRERRAVVGQQQFIVTASCASELAEQQRSVIDAWFEGACFEPR